MSTENMRVNLHMKADALARKVRTQKFSGNEGEGLIFQFLPSEEMEVVEMAAAQDAAGTRAAIDQLYADALEIYERARREVTIPRKDGREQAYAPVRYKRQIDRGYEDGVLVPTVARIVRKRTLGFGHLENAELLTSCSKHSSSTRASRTTTSSRPRRFTSHSGDVTSTTSSTEMANPRRLRP